MTEPAGWSFDESAFRAAKDRLHQAIVDVDEAMLGPRPANEHLTNYAVVCAHRRLSDDPEGDGDALTRITMPGQSLWQTLGLLETELVHIRAQIALGDDPEDP